MLLISTLTVTSQRKHSASDSQKNLANSAMMHVTFAPIASVQSIPNMRRTPAPEHLTLNHDKLEGKSTSVWCKIAAQDELSGLMEDFSTGKISAEEVGRAAQLACLASMRGIIASGDNVSVMHKAFEGVEVALSNFHRDISDPGKISICRATCMHLSTEHTRSDTEQRSDEMHHELEDGRAKLAQLECLLLEKKLRKLEAQLAEKQKFSELKAKLAALQYQLQQKAERAAAM